MTKAVHVEKQPNGYCLTTYAESLAEAQALVSLLLEQKSAEAFKPEPPPLPESVQVAMERAEAAEAE